MGMRFSTIFERIKMEQKYGLSYRVGREEIIAHYLNNTIETNQELCEAMHEKPCREMVQDGRLCISIRKGYPIANICGSNGHIISIARLICVPDLNAKTVARHRCHNRGCIEPTHLIEGTHSDNQRDNAYSPFQMPDDYDDEEELAALEYEEVLKERIEDYVTKEQT